MVEFLATLDVRSTCSISTTVPCSTPMVESIVPRSTAPGVAQPARMKPDVMIVIKAKISDLFIVFSLMLFALAVACWPGSGCQFQAD
jgi:hypothetical protein